MKHGRKDYDAIQDPTGKIPADEPVFLLRAQDETAAPLVRVWANGNERLGGDPRAIELARQHADKMDAWPVTMTNHRFIKASASSEPHQIAARIIKNFYHDTLGKIKPRIDFLFCYAAKDEAGNPKGPAIMLHGHPAYATIQVTALMHRALGEGDVLIKIDGEEWQKMPDAQKEALIDHELYHLNPEMVAGEENFKLDDLDRPKFKLREHDIQVGWFIAIAARHGAASIEVIQALAIKKQSGQMLFDFEGAAEAEIPDLIPAGA